VPDYIKELSERKSRMDASKTRAQQSVNAVLAALKKLDEALGDAHNDVLSFVGVGRKMQHELSKQGKQALFQERVKRMMPEVLKSRRVLQKGRAIALNARRELERLFRATGNSEK
jgi:hypothetical protein